MVEFRLNRLIISLGLREGNWENPRDRLNISRLIYSPGGIQSAGLFHPDGSPVSRCVFGHRPHWVYEITAPENGSTVYVGPDDARSLFPDHESLHQLSALRAEKESEIRTYRGRLDRALFLHGILGIDNPALTGMEKIGDRHYPAIDGAMDSIGTAWSFRIPHVPIETFVSNVDDLRRVIPLVRSGRIGSLGLENAAALLNIMGALEDGSALRDSDIAALIAIHGSILRAQNHSRIESLNWGRGRAVKVDTLLEPKTPAYHANLWISRWITENLLESGRVPWILDIGANCSVLWRVLKQIAGERFPAAANMVVDLENEEEIYCDAPNPNRVLADITALDDRGLLNSRGYSNDGVPLFFDEPHGFDVVVASFVFDQLRERSIEALIAIDRLIGNPAPMEEGLQGGLPLLIIASPENSPLIGTKFGNGIRRAGYSPLLEIANASNSLTEDARLRIGAEVGADDLRAVETAVSKPFHVSIFGKTEPIDLNSLRRLPGRDFVLAQGRSSRSRSAAVGTEENGLDRLDPHRLMVLGAIENIGAADIEIGAASQTIVSRDTIGYSADYLQFESNLACLQFFAGRLTASQNRDLETVLDLWDKQSAPCLTEGQAGYVMRLPAEITLTFDQAVESMPNLSGRLRAPLEEKIKGQKAAFETEEYNESRRSGRSINNYALDRKIEAFKGRVYREARYTLRQLYDMEEEFRQQNGTASVFEDCRPQVARTQNKILCSLRNMEGKVSRSQVSETTDVSARSLSNHDYRRLIEAVNTERRTKEPGRPLIIPPMEPANNPSESIRTALTGMEGEVTLQEIVDNTGVSTSTLSRYDYRKIVEMVNTERRTKEPGRPLIIPPKEPNKNPSESIRTALTGMEGEVTRSQIAEAADVDEGILNDCNYRKIIDEVNAERRKEEPEKPLIIPPPEPTKNAPELIRAALTAMEGEVTRPQIAEAADVHLNTLKDCNYRKIIDGVNAERREEEPERPLIIPPPEPTKNAPELIRAALTGMEGQVTRVQIMKTANVKNKAMNNSDYRKIIDEVNAERLVKEPERPLIIPPRERPKNAPELIRAALTGMEGKVTRSLIAEAVDVDKATLNDCNYREIIDEVNAERQEKEPERPLIIPPTEKHRKIPSD